MGFCATRSGAGGGQRVPPAGRHHIGTLPNARRCSATWSSFGACVYAPALWRSLVFLRPVGHVGWATHAAVSPIGRAPNRCATAGQGVPRCSASRHDLAPSIGYGNRLALLERFKYLFLFGSQPVVVHGTASSRVGLVGWWRCWDSNPDPLDRSCCFSEHSRSVVFGGETRAARSLPALSRRWSWPGLVGLWTVPPLFRGASRWSTSLPAGRETRWRDGLPFSRRQPPWDSWHPWCSGV